jgi:hypothetical protein
MNKIVEHFFHQSLQDSEDAAHFYRVIPIHNTNKLSLDEIQTYLPTFPRGWFELSRVSTKDRIEFTREFWRSTLPYLPHCDEGIVSFFETLDEIAIFLIQSKENSPFEAQMVYSLEDNTTFFHGNIPIQEPSLLNLHQGFGEDLLPNDYLAFLQIHDGFSKYTDTGLLTSDSIRNVYGEFQQLVSQLNIVETSSGNLVNTKKIIPFYESFGMHCYQCFYGEWYPEQEMGNLYFSGIDHTFSDFEDLENLEVNMAFPNFIDWLLFYLEKIV